MEDRAAGFSDLDGPELGPSLSFEDADAFRFCSRASLMRARMSSSGDAVSSFSFWDFVRRLVSPPSEAWALASAPNEMLFREDFTSELPSKSSAESTSLASEPASEFVCGLEGFD